jgi:hypothetical protein
MRRQITIMAVLAAGGVLSPEPAWAQLSALAQRCSVDVLPADHAEARLGWMRRCALVTNVVDRSKAAAIGLSASEGNPMYDYTETSDFFGLNSYLGSGSGFQANETYISMLYNNGGFIYQTPDSDAFVKWTKDLSRKRARPYYPVYGNQYNVSSGAQLYPHPTLANCSLYTSASGGTTSGTFYMNGFCEALPVTSLTKNVTVSSLSDSAGGRKYYSLSVPAGVSTLTFETSGGTGNVDLYVRSGSSPTFSTYNCRPSKTNNSEVCTFSAPSSGTWYVMLYGPSSYSGVSLNGRY